MHSPRVGGLLPACAPATAPTCAWQPAASGRVGREVGGQQQETKQRMAQATRRTGRTSRLRARSGAALRQTEREAAPAVAVHAALVAGTLVHLAGRHEALDGVGAGLERLSGAGQPPAPAAAADPNYARCAGPAQVFFLFLQGLGLGLGRRYLQTAPSTQFEMVLQSKVVTAAGSLAEEAAGCSWARPQRALPTTTACCPLCLPPTPTTTPGTLGLHLPGGPGKSHQQQQQRCPSHNANHSPSCVAVCPV